MKCGIYGYFWDGEAEDYCQLPEDHEGDWHEGEMFRWNSYSDIIDLEWEPDEV